MNRNDDPDSDSADADRLPRPDALDSPVNPRLIRLTKADDALASFGTETGADPLPGEPPAYAASQQGSEAGMAPIPPRVAPPAAARSVPFVARAGTAARALTRAPISKLILWPLLTAAAVFIGVALGTTYARYVRSKPVAIAERAPGVTKPGRGVAPETVPGTGAAKEESPLGPPAPRPSNVKPPRSSPARPQPTVPATRPERDRPATVADLPAVPLNARAAVLPPSTAVPLPTVPSAAPSAPPEKPTSGDRERLTAANDQRAIRTILDAYRVAYEQRDTVAAARLWPGVDTRALTRAFGTLASHRMTFDRCDVAVTGMQAQARCDGTINYTPRVGDTQPQSRSMSWTFALDRSSGQWRISNVRGR